MVKQISNNNSNKNRNKNKAKKQGNSFNQDTYDYRKFASASASVGGTTSSSSNITEARLKSMIKDPSKNASQVGSLSKSLKQSNGIYKSIIEYFGSLLTFDHLIYPVIENPISFMEDPSEMQIQFSENAKFLDRLNPKFHLPIFTDSIFTNGSTFLYKLEDSKSVAYMEFPNAYCRIGFIEDGVYRYQIDVSKITEATLISYPKEIQNAFTGYKNGSVDKLIEGKWYQVSDKGVAFTLDTSTLSQGGVSMPPLSSAILDVIKIEKAKDEMEDTAKLDNTKIVHSKIQTDDKGRPLMELPVVHEYHNALKRSLPEGSVAITNPFETRVMTLNGTGRDGKFSLLEKAIDNLYEGAGVSKLLFAGDGASSQALERSIQVDCQWLYSFLLPMYSNYYNYELKKIGKKGTIWKAKFLQISHFDREDSIKTAKDQLSYGGSRQEYLAYTGMTPIEVANMLIFEQRVLNIDEFMVAKQTSHTMSSKDSDSETEVGAPKSDNPSDTTIRISDSE